jgi:DNA gyrase subunit A
MQVCLTNGNNEVLIANRNGRAIRFHESKVRVMGRTAAGVRGMILDNEPDEVIGMVCIKDQERESVLVVSEKGYGKRSKITDYRITNRGGKGVKTINVTEKTGKLVGMKSVTEDNDLMIINKSGLTIRVNVSALNVIGRAAQGVRLINLKRNDEIASVCKVMSEKEEIGESTETTENEVVTDNLHTLLEIAQGGDTDEDFPESEEELVEDDENIENEVEGDNDKE